MANLTTNVGLRPGTKVGMRGRGPGKGFFSYLFVLPHVLFMLIFSIGPGLYALLISFASFKEGRPQLFQAGFANYIKAYTDFRFVGVFLNIGHFLLFSVPFGIIMVVLLAMLLHMRPGPFSSFMRTVYFIPGAVSGPALVLLAIFMFDPNISPFRPLLRLMGFSLINDVIQPPTLPVLFTLVGFFGGAGGWIAIFYGALNGISTEVVEAATIDGCNAWQKALYIKYPLIRPYIVYMLILVTAGNVQLFAEPQLMGTAGGNVPANWAPNQLAYTYAFTLGNFGGAAALSLVMLIIGLIAAYLIVTKTSFFRIEA